MPLRQVFLDFRAGLLEFLLDRRKRLLGRLFLTCAGRKAEDQVKAVSRVVTADRKMAPR